MKLLHTIEDEYKLCVQIRKIITNKITVLKV